MDFALARRALLREFRRGKISRNELCDAQPELMRAATNLGDLKEGLCPVCNGAKMVSVFYAFGPKLPAHGRCLANAKELAGLGRLPGPIKVFEVEVCLDCRWNHMTRMVVALVSDDAESA